MMESVMSKYGICCIILSLEENDPPKKFQRMTYKKFSQTPRKEAVAELSKRILNNIDVTFNAIKYCKEHNFNYRLSSDLFSLITYDKADLSLDQLPDYEEIINLFKQIKEYNSVNNVRISLHPDQFNVLASKDENALARTIKELNFYSWVMDQMGCPADYNSPINLHINNNQDSCEEIVDRLSASFELLDDNCRSRIVFENDDKTKCWSVRKLAEFYYKKFKSPITFDFLHHKCHPDNLSEEEAFNICCSSWGDFIPLFHYSESRDEKNPRAHADYPLNIPSMYGSEIHLDFEFKMKEKAIERFLTL